MDIYHDEQDYLSFLKRIKTVLGVGIQHLPLRITPLPKNSFTILSYCLMPNHFHLMIRQNLEFPVSKLISKVCTSYSMYFNKKYDHVGGVFQDQYKAVLVDNDSYLLWLSAYIHQNPVVAGLVADLETYPYSSYLDYIGRRDGVLIDKDFILGMVENKPMNYKKFVFESFEKIKQRKDLERFLID